jgi:tetratricopeptide (TPR) repeat protein
MQVRLATVAVFCLGARAATGLPEAGSPTSPVDYTAEPLVYELSSTAIVLENDGRATRDTVVRVRIQSDAALKKLGVLVLSYQSAFESVEIQSVKVLKPDGLVIPTHPDAVQDMASEISREAPFYSDLREKHVSVKGLAIGDVLEWRAIWRVTKPMVPGQFWLSFRFTRGEIVLSERLQVSVPAGRDIRFESEAFEPAVETAGGRRVYTWTTSCTRSNSSAESKREDAELLQLSARGRLPAPDVEISTFLSWEALGVWYDGLARDLLRPSPEIRAKAADLTRGAENEDARIRAIYQFVSTQVRYVGISFGIGRYRPHSAAEVLANGYGDCKDKHTLLASLLGAVGVKAFPVLVNGSFEINRTVPSPGQFDHMITAVPQGDSLLWLDATAEVAPPGYLRPALRGKQALLIPLDSPARFVETPQDPPSAGREHFRIEGRLDDVGTLEARIERSIQGGDNELPIRAAFRSVSRSQQNDLVQLISVNSGFAGQVSEANASDPARTDEPMKWTYRYKREDFPDWANRRIADALPPLVLPDSKERPSRDVWLGSRSEWDFVSVLELPEGSTPRVPPKVELQADFGEYSCRRSVQGRVLTTERRLMMRRREIPLDGWDAYKKFADAVHGDQMQLVDLKAPVRLTAGTYIQAIWDLPESENPEAVRAFEQVRTATQRQDMQAVVAALRRCVALDPKYTRVWLALGEFYRYQGKRKEALEAYRAAVRNDPAEPLSYKVLAFNLVDAANYQEAVEVWKRLLEIEPQDPDAPEGLASALIGASRSAEAISTLRAAIDREPDRAELYLQLGRAAARAGSDAEASAAFAEALARNPSSSALNSTAYDLAIVGKQLPAALQLAERAVREKERDSASVDLSNLKLDDLAPTRSLPAYWDTLGWVYFRMGNLARAERYLQAAWSLSQNTTEGDHLGQLYEKQGKREQAARMYRLAIAASRLSAPPAEIQRRLSRLGGSAKAESTGRDELTRLRSYRLDLASSEIESAECFVLFGEKSRVLDVRFVSGSNELKSAAKAIRSVQFREPIPDAGPTRLLRRGVVGCAPDVGCSLVFYTPDLVISID